ncbi:MAG: 16S rRNA (cytosine(1402)-N(4))-methyltransferase RsmH [Actinobacteria bacterium]|nr:16S rRNA (cytosine(1402)-N(4))-methyltransferase RsmH [Actinomycetota bacterium]
MSQVFEHEPVMADEIVAILGDVPPGLLVDATVGGGGHARALLGARPQSRLLGIDRDDDALAAAARTLAPFGDRVRLVRARFDQLPQLVQEPVSGVLFDLGVSSYQLDMAERGFSYRADAPLDMRMDRTSSRTAADVVNDTDERELARLFFDNGERRFARRIAQRIVANRPITTTAQLADVVRDAIPAATRRTGGHPAKRVFQAVRIAVNDELDILPGAIDAAVDVLRPGGRCAVLSYHSGEDRIVKDRFVAAATGGCTCPPNLPCVCGAQPVVRLLNRGARRPSAGEVARNPRAESARLRAVEKLATDAPDDRAPGVGR